MAWNTGEVMIREWKQLGGGFFTAKRKPIATQCHSYIQNLQILVGVAKLHVPLRSSWPSYVPPSKDQ